MAPLRARRTLIGAAALSLLCAGATAVAEPVGAAPVTTTWATIVGEEGEPVTGGRTTTFTGLSNVRVVQSSSFHRLITLDYPNSGYGSFRLTFSGPWHGTLTIGPHESAGAYNDGTRTGPGIEITGNGRACSNATGRFEVLDLDEATGRLWIVFEQRCEGTGPALFGEIRVNQPGDSAMAVTPAQARWPVKPVGAAQRTYPIRVVNTGTQDQTISGASISGPAAAEFAIASNSCGPLYPGADCWIEVLYFAVAEGRREATLTVDGSAGPQRVALVGPGTDPDDPVVAAAVGAPPGPALAPSFAGADGSATLAWTNPGDPDWLETVVCVARGTTPPTQLDGCRVGYRGRGANATIGGLEGGVPYSFALFTRDIEGKTSAPTRLTAPGAVITMTATPARPVYGDAVTLKGTVKDAATGAPLDLRPVRVLATSRSNGEVSNAGSGQTRADGSYDIQVDPGQTYVLTVVFPGDGYHLGDHADLLVPVTKHVYFPTLTVKSQLKLGKTLTFLVGVEPASPGQKAKLQRLVNGKWKTIATGNLSQDSLAKVRLKPKRTGKYVFRVLVEGDYRAETGTSRRVTVRVR